MRGEIPDEGSEKMRWEVGNGLQWTTPVIELSGVGRVQPPVHFSTPQLILKNYLGVRLNPQSSVQ